MDVDAIFVISLDNADERRDKMKEWYPSDANLQFFIVQRMKNPEMGCYTSHQKVLIHAKKKGFKRILVLEDDAFPLFPWNTIITHTNNALKYLKDKSWTYLMLGYLPIRSYKTTDSNVIEVKCAYDAHAYIINVDNVKAIPWKSIPIDRLLFCGIKTSSYSNIKFLPNEYDLNRVYATTPMLITQKTTKSQINPAHLTQKLIFELFGGEHRISEASCHVNILYAGIIIVLLLACIPFLLGFGFGGYKKTCIGFGIVLGLLFLIFIIFIIIDSIN